MKLTNFGHVISHGQEAYPISLRHSKLVKMIVSTTLFRLEGGGGGGGGREEEDIKMAFYIFALLRDGN